MIALCIEDEPILIKNLVRVVKSSPHITEVFAFDDEINALEWAEENNFDFVFLDIRLHSMDGLEVAEKLAEKNPNAMFIFCTGYKEFAFDAIQLHLNIGYLLKPVTAEAVCAEIEKMLKIFPKKLKVKCFGNFEVFFNDKPLTFSRKKTKELFAYLIDRCGSLVTPKDICSVLWEDDNNMSYFRHLIADMRKTFQEVGIENILISENSGYAVDKNQLDCDYYKFLDGDEVAIKNFLGEYMANYSWAEMTCAEIVATKNFLLNSKK